MTACHDVGAQRDDTSQWHPIFRRSGVPFATTRALSPTASSVEVARPGKSIDPDLGNAGYPAPNLSAMPEEVEMLSPKLPFADDLRSSIEARRQRLSKVLNHGWAIDLPEAISKLESTAGEGSAAIVEKAVAGVASVTHVGHRAHPRRWPVRLGGLLLAGLAGWAILRNPSMHARLARTVSAFRAQISAARTKWSARRVIERSDPIAFDAAETAPIQASPYADATSVVTDYPAGLGSNNGSVTPVLMGGGPA